MFVLFLSKSSCCTVVELFPQSSGCRPAESMVCTYHRRKAHGNHARYLGYRYEPLTARPGSLSPSGTTILPEDLRKVFQEL